MKIKITFLYLILFLAFGYGLKAQTVIPRDWHMLDLQQDHVYGISINKAYDELLKGRKSTPVVVAIIDSGVDTLHEDLKPDLWHNPLEKPNGLDNDKNGYVGDIFGWNFIGSKDPNKNLTKDTEEYLRVYYNNKNRFENITSDTQLPKKERKSFHDWQRSKLAVLQSTREARTIAMLKNQLKAYSEYNPFFQKELHKDTYTLGELKGFKTTDEQKALSQRSYINMFRISTGENADGWDH